MAAARALSAALSGHAGPIDADFAELADAVARDSGAAGWCAVQAGGALAVGPAVPPGLAVTLDGRACRRSGEWRLPRGWQLADRLEATAGGRPLIGSPIALDRIRRTEGFVAAHDGGVEGWAWHPGDPDVDPVLRLVPLGGGTGFEVPATTAMDIVSDRPLARPRRFRVAAERLAACAGPWRVLGREGRDLLGSPLDPGAERRGAAAVASAVARRLPADGGRRTAPAVPSWTAVAADLVGSVQNERPRRTRAATIVIPVHGGAATTLACLAQVRATVPAGTRVVVVDDAGPEPALAYALERLAAAGRIRLIRHRSNRGFPAAANTGMRAAAGRDVVLLNSDTLTAPHWLERLREAAYAADDIGTATPLSNDATILSYPAVKGGNAVPDLAAVRRLAALAHQANPGAVVDIPTAVGFCMYIRRDCLDAVGLLREDLFAQGYGEENDFCLRARHLGWRHVAAAGVYVGHVGGGSFGAARAHLVARNLAVLNRLHPGYDALIAAHVAADPLGPARRRLDMVRWRQARNRERGSALLISHDMGGGVQRQIETRCAALSAQGLRPIVLRPDLLHPGICVVDDGALDGGAGRGFPNLRFAVPGELKLLARLLQADRPVHAELHHLLGHDHRVLDLVRLLELPYDAFVHDYAWLCPRIALVNAERRYCGEPDAATCENCIADAGRNIADDIPVADLRSRSALDLAGARAVIAPSADAASRITRHFPAVRPLVQPWEDDAALPPASAAHGPVRRVGVVGAIGVEKGFDVLLAAARDAARRALPLEFVVIGYTIDDQRLLATGRVFVTGEYRGSEVPALIRREAVDLAWLPSIWPETWCFALTEAWRAGLAVAAFDIGAPAERIRRTGRGFLLPLGLPAPAINAALLRRGRERPSVRRPSAGPATGEVTEFAVL
ncbi:MAG: glycosyltransferase [Acidisphaera sp.]|nr:glycosyltransferase [Acidisphaera sp.]